MDVGFEKLNLFCSFISILICKCAFICVIFNTSIKCVLSPHSLLSFLLQCLYQNFDSRCWFSIIFLWDKSCCGEDALNQVE